DYVTARNHNGNTAVKRSENYTRKLSNDPASSVALTISGFVIKKHEYNLKLKVYTLIGCFQICAQKQPIRALYFEFDGMCSTFSTSDPGEKGKKNILEFNI
ncbi:MAG: hypothetical protein AB2693_19560, partial [Candidatus Thiodiazotropha sp.]